MTQEEINHYLYQIELATKEFPNDSDLGGAVRQLMLTLEKERGTSLVFNEPNNTQNTWGDADED
jgi:hypothetical protein